MEWEHGTEMSQVFLLKKPLAQIEFESYSELSQTSKAEHFAKKLTTVLFLYPLKTKKNEQPWVVFAKYYQIQIAKYTAENLRHFVTVIAENLSGATKFCT